MNYCANCEKITNDNTQNTFTEHYSSRYLLAIVSCEECGSFKFQYLVEKEEK